jgi:hypothetical protein
VKSSRRGTAELRTFAVEQRISVCDTARSALDTPTSAAAASVMIPRPSADTSIQ